MNIQSIERRRSIRRFKADPIPKATIHQVLEAARLAPSAKNGQPWEFCVLGPESREIALSAMEESIRARLSQNQNRAGLASAAATLRVMKNAPMLILMIRPEGKNPFESIGGMERVLEMLDVLSMGAAIENMLLEAESLGLGTLWIGNTFFAYDDLVSALNLSGQLLGAVALGYPDEAPPSRPRKSLEEVARFLP